MKRIIVWDLPMRLFHWIFAGSLTGALAIGFLMDNDSPLFPYHMLLGLVAGFSLVVRIILGVFGSRHNRFTAMPLHPGEILRYLTGAISGNARRYIGHNPGGAVAALLMFALVPLLIASGTGWLDDDLHEGLAIGLLVTVGLHLAGIIWHTIRHKEAIAMSMVTGTKQGPETEGLKGHSAPTAIAMLLVTAAWVAALFDNYNPRAETVKLPLLPTTLQMGEGEGEEEHEEEHHGHDDDDD
jgi:cytochrome b